MSVELAMLPQGAAANPAALVAAVNDRLRRISAALGPGAAGAAGAPGLPGAPGTVGASVLYGTHAARLGRAVPADATIYIETDRSNVEYQTRGTGWVFVAGRMVAAWAEMPTDLGAADAGFVFFDGPGSLHIWQWTGLAWTWGPGDRHSGEFAQFDADPGAGWHLCDGSTNQTKYGGNGARTTTFTVPDQREFYLKASATYTGAGVAAGAPGITGATATGNAALSGITGNDGGVAQTVQSGTGATVPAEPHQHGAGAIVDDGHTHAIGTLAVDATGKPATFAVLPYYRL